MLLGKRWWTRFVKTECNRLFFLFTKNTEGNHELDKETSQNPH